MRLSHYESEIDLCEPSDSDLRVGTSIQSRGRRGSEGGVETPHPHNMRIDHQSMSQTAGRSDQDHCGASKKTRENGTAKHSPR